MSDGFAALADMQAAPRASGPLADVKGDDWRNILVLGRATKTGVYAETLALVGRARFLADELGCRVDVLLIGSDLEAATKELQRYPIDAVYRVKAPDYAPIDHTAKILTEVVRKRRPELILVFQSRTGDAVAAYAASQLRVGFAIGATDIRLDTAERRALVTHETGTARFQVVTTFEQLPQFVTVQRGLFRAPLEDRGETRVHDVELSAGKIADIKVVGLDPPPKPTLSNAERVVVAGARLQSHEEIELARELARKLDAQFGVTVGIVERGLLKTDDVVGLPGHHRIAPKLLVAVGMWGALDFLEAVGGHPTICAIGCDAGDPIAKRSSYFVSGDVKTAMEAVLKAL